MIEEKSKEIDILLKAEADKWVEKARQIDASINEEQAILKSDAAQTDKSENAVYQIAKDNYARLQLQKRDVDNKLVAFKAFDTEYVKSDYITIGTTVKIKLLKENGSPSERSHERYIKIVPPDVGAAQIGAVSVSSKLGKNIQGKYVGDVVVAQTRIGEVEWLIEEVY